MPIFLIIMVLFVIVSLLFLIQYKRIKKYHFSLLIGATILMFAAHLIFEDARWQLYPLYVSVYLCLWIGIFLLANTKSFEKRIILRKVFIFSSSVLILVSLLLNLVFPIYEVPVPSGEYFIGTESFVLVDENREELYADTGKRKIKIQFWYPAETTEGYELAPWLEDGVVVAQSLASDAGLPSFVLNHTELIMSNSYESAPISNALEQYPVVIISHGWRGFRNLHTDMAEELASLGYIVISIDHTYGSVATVFGEDDIAYINREALPDVSPNSLFLEYANILVNTYAGDISFTLDELEKMNIGTSVTMFEGKLDLEKIGLLGHSTGGGAGVTVALNDERIKAIIGMDAWVEPVYETEIVKGLNMPAFFFRSSSWEIGNNNVNLNHLMDSSSEYSWLYQIDGTVHTDYSMSYMLSPLMKYVGYAGTLDSDYLVSILKTTIVGFFDENLKEDSNIDLNNLNEIWEEVRRIEE